MHTAESVGVREHILGAGVFPGLGDPFSCFCTKRSAQISNLSSLNPVQKVGKSCWERVTPQLRQGRKALGPLVTQIRSPWLQGLQSGFIATAIKIEKLIAWDRFSWYTERCFILKFVVLLVEQGTGRTCGPCCAIPAPKGCLQEKQGSSAGRLNQMYWGSWALGQHHTPPPNPHH